MKKLHMSRLQLEQIVELAHKAIGKLQQFVQNPEIMMAHFAAMLGFHLSLELPLDPELPKIVEHPRSSAPPRPIGERLTPPEGMRALSNFPPTSPPGLEVAPTMPPTHRRRQPTPQERAGTEELLQGRTGEILGPAGPGSYRVLLEDGSEVVLAEHALSLAGIEPPQPQASATVDTGADDARIDSWKQLIDGREGKILSVAGEGSYVVAFDDGQQLTLPAAALQYAGCEPPT